MRDIYDFVGRMLISIFFLVKGVEYILHISKMKRMMTEYHITWGQNFWLWGAIFLLILGSFSVWTGYRTRFGATLLLLYWIPVVIIVHPFWQFSGVEFHAQLENFMLNMAVAGGLFMVLLNPPGKYSVKKLLATTKVRR